MLNYQRVIVGFVKTKIVRGFNGGFKHQVNGNFRGYTVMDILYITHHNYRAVSEHEMGNLTPKMAILIRQPMIYQFTNEFWDKYFFFQINPDLRH